MTVRSPRRARGSKSRRWRQLDTSNRVSPHRLPARRPHISPRARRANYAFQFGWTQKFRTVVRLNQIHSRVGPYKERGWCCWGIPVFGIPRQVGRKQEKVTYKLSSQDWVFVFINYEENRNLNSLLMLESYGCYYIIFYVLREIWLRSVSCKSHPKNAAKPGVFPIPTTPDVVRYK